MSGIAHPMKKTTNSQSIKHRIIFILFVLLTLFCFLPVANEIKVGIVILFTIFLWATSALPEWLSALFFLTICCVCRLAPTEVVLSGFTSSAAWLVVPGIIISAAIVHTGLGHRVARVICPVFRGSCQKAISMSVLFGVLTSFIMPSAMNRIILMLPLLDSIASKLGYQPQDNGYRGIVIGGVLGTYLPALAILPANVPNNVLAGLIESIYHVTPTYTGYLLLHFPVLGALKTLVIILVLGWCYRQKSASPVNRMPDALPQGETMHNQTMHDKTMQNKNTPAETITSEQPAASRTQYWLGIILLLAMLLWFTEPYHKIPAAWVSMLVAIICLYPDFGFMPEKPLSKLNLSSFFYVSAIVSLGAVAYYSHVAGYIANYLFQLLPIQAQAFNHNFLVLSALSTLIGFIVTTPGVPSVLTPMSDLIARMSALPVDSVYMLQVVGFSTLFFIYQAPPLVMAVQSGKIKAAELTKATMIIGILSVLLLWPIDMLWWHVVK